MNHESTTAGQHSGLRSIRGVFVSPRIRWLAMLGVCAAYLQGGIDKAIDFQSAIGEMQHFGIAPPAPFAAATIGLELGASLLILTGAYRWLGALALAAFTLIATFLANRFWTMTGAERFMTMNSFFEHLGLVGSFVLIAWYDLLPRRRRR